MSHEKKLDSILLNFERHGDMLSLQISAGSVLKVGIEGILEVLRLPSFYTKIMSF